MSSQTKKIIALLSFPFLFQMLVSCHKSPGPVQRHYTNKFILADNLDNSGKEAFVTYTNSVIKKAYGISVKLFREKMVYQAAPAFFIQAAYAYSNRSEDVIYSPVETIKSIKIITVNNFDSSHPANADVTSYFSIFGNNKFYTVNNYSNYLNSSLYERDNFESITNFFLMTLPAAASVTHKFKVQFFLSNGKILEATTTQIDLI